MATLEVNLDLVKKYNQPGPRYTSYPPATHFTDSLSKEDLLAKIGAYKARTNDISLYFHLPFCQSLCWYCGCTTVITKQHDKGITYLDYLEREMDLMMQNIDPSRQVKQIHLGGGTPTFHSPDEIRKLGEMIRSRFNVAADAEASVEVDPRRLTREHIIALREAGFNRASLGIQDNNEKVQEAVNRIQPFSMTTQVTEWLREEGFTSINFDLIYGLPLQTPATFSKTLDEVLSLSPDRFAVFSYAHVPWVKPAQTFFTEIDLPDATTKLDLLKLTVERLTEAGYVYIGMDHFVKPTDELAIAQQNRTLQRNFQGYSTHGGTDIYAFGMSAISQAGELYWQNEKDLKKYYEFIDKGELPIIKGYVLSKDDKIRRDVIMEIMCSLSLDYNELSSRLGIDFKTYFAKELDSLARLEADGLLVQTPNSIHVTDNGRLFIRNIAMQFDAYLSKETEVRYSKTI
jgi:oxygen-independent coproporphyrinogen-3 oxidase